MKKILMLALTATMMLVACKKDKGGDEPETIPTCAMVKTIERWGGSEYIDTDVIRFDEQGRIKEVSGSNNTTDTYEYHSDKIIYTETYPGQKNVTTYTLDGQGRVIKSVDKYGTTDYEYNNDGYLIKSTQTNNVGGGTEAYTWESGNLVKIVRDNDDVTNITYGNDVITDKLVAGDIFSNIYSEWMLQDYFGKQPKNAPIREQTSGTYGKTDIYSYTKDGKGKITGYTQTQNGNSIPDWEYSVDYNCK